MFFLAISGHCSFKTSLLVVWTSTRFPRYLFDCFKRHTKLIARASYFIRYSFAFVFQLILLCLVYINGRNLGFSQQFSAQIWKNN